MEDGGQVSQGDVLAYQSDDAAIIAANPGRVRIESIDGSDGGSAAGTKMIVSREIRQQVEYEIPSTARMLVKDGDRVEAGQPLTEGSLNPHRILRIQGRQACCLKCRRCTGRRGRISTTSTLK